VRGPSEGEVSYAATCQVTIDRCDQFPSIYPEAHMVIQQIVHYIHYAPKDNTVEKYTI
jgi:hypothetical protein